VTHEPEPDSPETDAVRRLLADARHDDPIPGDVAARMDRVLADLAAGRGTADATETADDPDHGVVTRLPAHRRRRAAALLVAAAAIVVGGVVFAQHRPGTGSATAGSASSAESDSRFAGQDAAGGSSGPSNLSGSGSTQPQVAPRATVRDGRLVVRRQHFAEDARAGQALLRADAAKRIVDDPACPVPGADGQVLAARYDRAPAALVYHPATGSTQVVDLVLCGSRRPLRSVTLPAP